MCHSRNYLWRQFHAIDFSTFTNLIVINENTALNISVYFATYFNLPFGI